MNEVVGLVDYVFVAKVIHNEGTIYKDVVMIEDKEGIPKELGSPYTIEVVDNIKGRLLSKENAGFFLFYSFNDLANAVPRLENHPHARTYDVPSTHLVQSAF